MYLARGPEGRESFDRFVQSYGEFPAGTPHDLIVLYKGFNSQAELSHAREAFSGVRHTGIELTDVGFDIGSYIECSQRIKHYYICFLNTHSQIASDGWLAQLLRHAARPEVGIAGASGSYESLKRSWQLIQKYYWLYYARGIRYPDRVDRYYVKFKDYLPGKPLYPEVMWQQYSGVYAYLARLGRWAHTHIEHVRFRRYWHAMTRPSAVLDKIAAYPDFPNPHIRSNGFVVKRDHILTMQDFRVTTKNDACMFESGPDSFTVRLRRKGLGAVVVGKDGLAYDVAHWPRSKTFRLEDQGNLLLADNHSRSFDQMTREDQFTHAYMTWGEYMGCPPKDFPTLGIRFKQASLQPRLSRR